MGPFGKYLNSVDKMKKLSIHSEYTTVYENSSGPEDDTLSKYIHPVQTDKYGMQMVMCCNAKTFPIPGQTLIQERYARKHGGGSAIL